MSADQLFSGDGTSKPGFVGPAKPSAAFPEFVGPNRVVADLPEVAIIGLGALQAVEK